MAVHARRPASPHHPASPQRVDRPLTHPPLHDTNLPHASSPSPPTRPSPARPSPQPPLRSIRPLTAWPPELGSRYVGRLPGVPVGLPPPRCPGEWGSMTSDGRLWKLQLGGGTASTEVLFYNATRDTEFRVECLFSGDGMSPGSPRVSYEADRSGQQARIACTLSPGETVSLARGRLGGSELRLTQTAVSLHSPAIPPDLAARLQRGVSEEMSAAAAAAAEATSLPTSLASADPPARAAAAACLRSGTPYVDTQFPPAPSSAGVTTREPLIWRRFGSYLHPPPPLGACQPFRSPPEPNDIDPGQLGDTWLASAFSIASEVPGAIPRLFAASPEDLRLREVGAYSIRLCAHGWWQDVTVDDYIPCSLREPLFARCVEDPAAMWPSLLQKAFAKVHGSYARILSGDTLLALSDMTGCPCDRFDLRGSDPHGAFDALADAAGASPSSGAAGADSIIFLHAPSNGDRRDYEGIGFLPGHSYAVLDVVAVQLLGGGGSGEDSAGASPQNRGRAGSPQRRVGPGVVRMLKVRNPWGDAALYDGRWCDADPLWGRHPEVRVACRKSGPVAEGGAVWMDFETAARYFDTGGVVRAISQRWLEIRIASEFQRGEPLQCLEIWPMHASECFFGVHVRSTRSTDWLACMLTVVSPEGGSGWVVRPNAESHGGRFCRARDVSLRVSFSGPHASRRPHYLIWRCKDPGADRQAVVSMHASSKFATLVCKRATPAVLQPLQYPQPWGGGGGGPAFDPSGCQPVAMTYQVEREGARTAKVIDMGSIRFVPQGQGRSSRR